jgi:hypothetical protein
MYILHITLTWIEVDGLVGNSAYPNRKKRDLIKFYWINFLNFISLQLKCERYILY